MGYQVAGLRILVGVALLAAPAEGLSAPRLGGVVQRFLGRFGTSRQVAASGVPSTETPTGTSFLSEDTIERAKAGNKFEKVKLEKDGTKAWTEMSEFAKAIRDGKTSWEDIAGDDIDIRLKWSGLFHRRKATPGRFMMRLKVPNGIVNSEQLRYYGDAVEPYGPELGVVDITTRMNIQLRGMPLEDASDISAKLYELGQCSIMSGMDNVRNLVGSPIAGIDPEELIDTRQICEDINNMYTNNRQGNAEWGNLPRKFNIAVSGSYDDFAHTHINDIGLQPVPHAETGEMGFNVIMGGYFSIKRAAMSYPIDMWITPDQAVNLSKSTLRIFRDEGDRKDRQKARLIWLIEKWGIPKWREELVAEMQKNDASFKPQSEQPEPAAKPRRDLLGVHVQSDSTKRWVGALVPVGRLSPAECRQVADLADDFSGGEVRLTVEQNIIFPNVDESRVDALVEKIEAMDRITSKPGNLLRGAVACTGAQFCPVALSETKNMVSDLIPALEARLDVPEMVRIHTTGCPNSCAQAQVADIGLMGAPAKKFDEALDKKVAVSGFNVLMGGTIGQHPALGEITEKGIPGTVDDLVPVLEKILVEKFGATPKK